MKGLFISFLDNLVEMTISSKPNLKSRTACHVPAINYGRSELGSDIFTDIDKAIQCIPSWIK